MRNCIFSVVVSDFKMICFNIYLALGRVFDYFYNKGPRWYLSLENGIHWLNTTITE